MGTGYKRDIKTKGKGVYAQPYLYHMLLEGQSRPLNRVLRYAILLLVKCFKKKGSQTLADNNNLLGL